MNVYKGGPQDVYYFGQLFEHTEDQNSLNNGIGADNLNTKPLGRELALPKSPLWLILADLNSESLSSENKYGKQTYS